MSVLQQPLPFSIHSTLGAVEIGLLVSQALFGINTLQTYIYYKTFPKDHRALKYTVATVWLMDFVHAILISHAFYTMSVINYGNPMGLLKLPPTLEFSFLPAQVVELMVQIYFSVRIFRFSRNYIIPAICIFLSVLGFGGVVAIVGLLFSESNLTTLEFVTKYKWLVSLVHVAGAVDEVLLAVTLIYILWKQKSMAYKTTSSILDKLMIWTIQTGLITSMIGTVKLIVIFTMVNLVWLGLFMFLCRVFTNSFLLALNGRETLRKMRAGATTIDMSTTPGSEIHGQSARRQSDVPLSIGVKVSRSMNRDEDYYPMGKV